MLKRTEHSNGVVTYQSELLARVGVRHGFSTRVGGVSEGAFASLNLGNAAGAELQDGEGNLVENYERLQKAIGAEDCLRVWVKQVHGRMVELVDFEPEGEYAETLEAEVRDRFSGQLSADALVTGVKGVLLTIRVADCVPVLIASGDGKVVGAVHAGWRGVVGNVAEKTVRAFGELGVKAEGLVAAIGPCIGLENFEVGVEVGEEFERQGLGAFVVEKFGGGEKPHVDLQGAVREQLVRAGLRAEDVEGNGVCTYRDSGDFFSHRRENGVTGRMAGVIAVKG